MRHVSLWFMLMMLILDENINTIKSREALLVAFKEVGLEGNNGEN